MASNRAANISAFDPDQQRVIEDIYNTLGNVSIRTANGGVLYLIGGGGGRSGGSALDYLNRKLDEVNTRYIPELKENLDTLGHNLDDLNNEIDDKFPITKTDIADDAISTPKLEANAVTAAKINVSDIVSNSTLTDELVANTAFVENLTTDSTFTNSLVANTAFIDSIATNSALINELTSNTAFIEEIFAGDITLTGSISNPTNDWTIDDSGISMGVPDTNIEITSSITWNRSGGMAGSIGAAYNSSLNRTVLFYNSGYHTFQINGSGALTLTPDVAYFNNPIVLPRLTDAQRDSLSVPAGAIIFNIDSGSAGDIQAYYTDGQWRTIS